MPKAPRHRKRTRTARVDAAAAPGAASRAQALVLAQASPASEFATGSNGHQAHSKKVGKKEAEVANLLDKLKSIQVQERIWAASALASLLLSLPPVTLRLLLSKNLIGLLIERLSDTEDEVVVECLGALRNLAVSSPPSILSEMFNKRLLLPLLTLHLPLLRSLLPSMLVPAAVPQTAPLPSTPAARLAHETLQEHTEKRRRLYWDWTENVLMLLWCCAESNVKILGGLNNAGAELVEFLLSLFAAQGLGLESADREDGQGMEVEQGGKKGKKVKKAAEKKERIPLFVAVTAAQTLHALISSNLPAHTHVLTSAQLPSLGTILSLTTPPPTSSGRTDSHRSTAESDAEDYLTLRVLSFGMILELASAHNGKGKAAKELKSDMMRVLKAQQTCLLSGLQTDLGKIVQASLAAVQDMKPVNAETPEATPTGPSLKLASHEKNLSTLQLSLEILSSWCATLDAAGLGELNGADSGRGGDDEEEWGGIALLDQLAESDDEEENDDMEQDRDETMDTEQEEQDQTAGFSDPDEDEDEGDQMGVELSSEALQLVSTLPQLLLALAMPTPISFLQPVATPGAAPGLIPTSTAPAPGAPVFDLPPPLAGIADIVTTIHVRALECLNNLYITLARSSAGSGTDFLQDSQNVAVLQSIWEGVLLLVLGATNARVGAKFTKNSEEELENREMEIVMAGVGAVWGMARVGLAEGNLLAVGLATVPFLVSIFDHEFARAATPAGESIRVRIIGALGWIGRREDITTEENLFIGNFLLSILPAGKTASSISPTPEVLLQAIDSFIDIYSDENSTWDTAVFIGQNYLVRLQDAIVGVRSATKKIDKKKFPELRTRADGALENLVGFVGYRKGLVGA